MKGRRKKDGELHLAHFFIVASTGEQACRTFEITFYFCFGSHVVV